MQVKKLIKDQGPPANRSRRSLLTATALVVAITLALATGCTGGDGRTVKWRVSEADHSVSPDEAKQQATPVITAVQAAIDEYAGTSTWRPLTVRTEERDHRCGQIVSSSGSFMYYPESGNTSLEDTIAAAASSFGYTNLVIQHRGAGHGTEYADVATDDTMLVVGHEAGSDATIAVFIPAHHDQCAG